MRNMHNPSHEMKRQLGLVVLIIILQVITNADGCLFGPGCAIECHCSGGEECNGTFGTCPQSQCPEVVDFSLRWCAHGNLAANKNIRASIDSKTFSGFVDGNAVDGDLSTSAHPGFIGRLPKPSNNEGNVWIEIDLGSPHVVYFVRVYGRSEDEDRLIGTQVLLSSTGFTPDRISEYKNNNAQLCGVLGINIEQTSYRIFNVQCASALTGRYIVLLHENTIHPMPTREVIVQGCPGSECRCGNMYIEPSCEKAKPAAKVMSHTVNGTTVMLQYKSVPPHENIMQNEMATVSYYLIHYWREYGSNGTINTTNTVEQLELKERETYTVVVYPVYGSDHLYGFPSTAETNQTTCRAGRWGSNCTGHCFCSNYTCDPDTGRCSNLTQSCRTGYYKYPNCHRGIPSMSGSAVHITPEAGRCITIELEGWTRPSNDTHHVFSEPDSYIVEYQSNTTNQTSTIEVIATGDLWYTLTVSDLDITSVYQARVLARVNDTSNMYVGTPSEWSNGVQPVVPHSSRSASAAVIGSVVGVVLLILIIAAFGFVVFFIRSRNKKLIQDSKYLLKPVTANADPARTEYNLPERIATEDETESTGAEAEQEVTYVNQEQLSDAVVVENFICYTQQLMANDKALLNQQYSMFSKAFTYPAVCGQLAENKLKNRFTDIRPYDHSRVKLQRSDGDKGSDYINASYITGANGQAKYYIAAQGPKASTVHDTWLMIWQQQVNIIIMLTPLTENGKIKCAGYWPSLESTVSHGDIQVTTVAVESFAYYTHTTLTVEYKSESRYIQHLHFTGWTDHGTPVSTLELIDFRRRVKYLEQNKKGPTVVHCSAGVGRTGTYIALDKLMSDIYNKRTDIDVLRTVYHLRQERHLMVQTVSQYEFLYRALTEILRIGNTSISAGELSDVIASDSMSNRVNEEYRILCEEGEGMGQDEGEDMIGGWITCEGAAPENREKNRDVTVLPCDLHRPYLSLPVPDCKSYINAVIVDDFFRKESLICTQHPLPNTVVDLWRLVVDHEVDKIIMLSTEQEKQDMYWPTGDQTVSFGNLAVTSVEDNTLPSGVKQRTFKLTNGYRNEDNTKVLLLWEVTQWPCDVTTINSTSTQVIEVLELSGCLAKRTANDGVTLIVCGNGADRSGVFVSLCYALQKMSTDNTIDALYAVHQVKRCRAQFIRSVSDYNLLYHLINSYAESVHIYSN